MSIGNEARAGKSENKLPDYLERQFERFHKNGLFTHRNDMRELLLRQLVSPEVQERFKQRDSGISIIMDCYDRMYDKKKKDFEVTGRVLRRFASLPERNPSEHPGRKLVPEIRRMLARYYKHHGADDPVLIKIRKGEYWPEILIVRQEAQLDGNELKPPHTGTESLTLRAVDEFFGDGASTAAHKGVIILQSDHMDEVLKDEVLRARIAHPTSRLYKARKFLNAWDTYGAIAIQNEFQRLGLLAPSLILSEQHSQEHTDNATFKICMGLGFTFETRRAVKRICHPWAQISKSCGDALSFNQSLVPKYLPEKSQRLRLEKPEASYRRLVPSDWGENYIQRWLDMLEYEDSVNDYAIILRHTELEPRRHLLFVVAGFTERGTAVAGLYLAKNWRNLWKRYVRGHAHKGSLGDFMIVIEGVSDPKSPNPWLEVSAYEVTPEKLEKAGMTCLWSKRVPKTSGAKKKN